MTLKRSWAVWLGACGYGKTRDPISASPLTDMGPNKSSNGLFPCLFSHIKKKYGKKKRNMVYTLQLGGDTISVYLVCYLVSVSPAPFNIRNYMRQYVVK